jgi:hypothetical protein
MRQDIEAVRLTAIYRRRFVKHPSARHIGTWGRWGGVEVQLHLFTSTLDAGYSSALRPAHFIPDIH